MFKSDVLCLGSATLDNFLTIGQPLSQVKLGDKILVKSSEKHSGGGATNASAALSKLGLKAKILTKLGHDHDAEFILKELQHYHIKNLCRHASTKNTDFATIISSTQEKDRIIFVHKGASQDLRETDFPKSCLRTRWLYLATLIGQSLQTAQQIVLAAQKKKLKILFNPSLYLAQKGKRFLQPFLQASYILVLNLEEAQALLHTKNSSPQALLPRLQKLGPQIIVITNGPKTLSALDQTHFYFLQPPQVKVVHTAGAGDAFTAAFLAGLIKKYPFEDALRLGQVNASSVVQHLGTKNKLLTEKEAQVLIKKYKIKVSQKKC